MRLLTSLDSVRVWVVLVALAGCGSDPAVMPEADDDDASTGSSGGNTRRDDEDAGTRLDAGARDASSADARIADASAAHAGHAICPLDDDEATCGVCVKFSCCDEIAACGPACQELVKCANTCPSTSATDPCAQACYDAHPEGMAAFTAFASCLGVQCEEACAAASK